MNENVSPTKKEVEFPMSCKFSQRGVTKQRQCQVLKTSSSPCFCRAKLALLAILKNGWLEKILVFEDELLCSPI